MWSRTELKMRGKQAFRRNYWAAVLVAFVMTIVTGALSGGSAGSNTGNEVYNNSYPGGYGSEESMAMTAVTVMVAAVMGIVWIVIALLKIFIGNALLVGGSRFFVTNQTEDSRAGTLGYVFKSGHFGNVVLTMFLRDLFIGLWSLLLVIPGIIKHYEYLMIPYILAENPGMDRKEAFLISKKMMTGQKWNAFVMDLSFLGWRILEVFTLGILGIFYVEPYYQASIAEMYSFNRTLAYQNGYIR